MVDSDAIYSGKINATEQRILKLRDDKTAVEFIAVLEDHGLERIPKITLWFDSHNISLRSVTKEVAGLA